MEKPGSTGLFFVTIGPCLLREVQEPAKIFVNREGGLPDCDPARQIALQGELGKGSR